MHMIVTEPNIDFNDIKSIIIDLGQTDNQKPENQTNGIDPKYANHIQILNAIASSENFPDNLLSQKDITNMTPEEQERFLNHRLEDFARKAKNYFDGIQPNSKLGELGKTVGGELNKLFASGGFTENKAEIIDILKTNLPELEKGAIDVEATQEFGDKALPLIQGLSKMIGADVVQETLTKVWGHNATQGAFKASSMTVTDYYHLEENDVHGLDPYGQFKPITPDDMNKAKELLRNGIPIEDIQTGISPPSQEWIEQMVQGVNTGANELKDYFRNNMEGITANIMTKAVDIAYKDYDFDSKDEKALEKLEEKLKGEEFEKILDLFGKNAETMDLAINTFAPELEARNLGKDDVRELREQQQKQSQSISPVN